MSGRHLPASAKIIGHGSKQTTTPLPGVQQVVEQENCRGLAIGSGNAHDGDLFRGVPLQGRGSLGQSNTA